MKRVWGPESLGMSGIIWAYQGPNYSDNLYLMCITLFQRRPLQRENDRARDLTKSPPLIYDDDCGGRADAGPMVRSWPPHPFSTFWCLSCPSLQQLQPSVAQKRGNRLLRPDHVSPAIF